MTTLDPESEQGMGGNNDGQNVELRRVPYGGYRIRVQILKNETQVWQGSFQPNELKKMADRISAIIS